MADVIQAIDGPFTVTACSTDDHDCEQFQKCNVRDPLWRLRERIVEALGTVSVAELASDAERNGRPGRLCPGGVARRTCSRCVRERTGSDVKDDI